MRPETESIVAIDVIPEGNGDFGPRMVNLVGDGKEPFGGRFKLDDDASEEGLSNIWIQPVPEGRNSASFLITAVLVNDATEGESAVRGEISLYLNETGAVVDGVVTQNDRIVARLIDKPRETSARINEYLGSIRAAREATADEIIALDTEGLSERATDGRIERTIQRGAGGDLSPAEITADQLARKNEHMGGLNAVMESLTRRQEAGNDIVDIRAFADRDFLETLIGQLETMKEVSEKTSGTGANQGNVAA